MPHRNAASTCEFLWSVDYSEIGYRLLVRYLASSLTLSTLPPRHVDSGDTRHDQAIHVLLLVQPSACCNTCHLSPVTCTHSLYSIRTLTQSNQPCRLSLCPTTLLGLHLPNVLLLSSLPPLTMSCHKLVTHHVLPSKYKPSSSPTLIPCAAIESNTKPWPISMLWAFPIPSFVPAASHTPTPLLLASLAAALVVFPVLCAAIHQDTTGAATLCLDSSNPVAFIEATHASPLSSCIPSPANRYSPPQPPTVWTHPQLVDGLLIPSDLCPPVSSDWTGVSSACK